MSHCFAEIMGAVNQGNSRRHQESAGGSSTHPNADSEQRRRPTRCQQSYIFSSSYFISVMHLFTKNPTEATRNSCVGRVMALLACCYLACSCHPFPLETGSTPPCFPGFWCLTSFKAQLFGFKSGPRDEFPQVHRSVLKVTYRGGRGDNSEDSFRRHIGLHCSPPHIPTWVEWRGRGGAGWRMGLMGLHPTLHF